MEPTQSTEKNTETEVIKDAIIIEPEVVAATPVVAAPVAAPAAASRKKFPLLYVAIIVALIGIGFAFLYTKGYIVAASVDGSPISRLSVIRELEKQGGEQALEALIEKKMIEKKFEEEGVTIESDAVDKRMEEINAQVAAQGASLEEALAAQGMTEEQLRSQIDTQLKLEALLSDKTGVTGEEVDAHIKENKVTPPKGMTIDQVKIQITAQLKQEKFQAEAQKFMADIKEETTVKYYKVY